MNSLSLDCSLSDITSVIVLFIQWAMKLLQHINFGKGSYH